MRSQFTSFTPETMGALGNGITAMLGKFRTERLERADAAEDARKVYASELRSGVRALLERFELTRETMGSDIQAASQAFQKARPARRSRKR
jgi:hypothetical protein